MRAKRLLDAFEFGDGDAELLADAGIGAGGARGKGRAGSRQRRQRNAAAGGERRHQHLPALAEPLLAADDVVERNEDVLAPVRAVLEHLHRRQMAMADADAGQMRRDQRDGDAEFVFAADEMIGIVGLEGETEQRRDGAERDVALVPVQLEAEHFLAFEIALADDAASRSSRRRRSRLPDWSGRSRECRGRRPAAAASDPAAPWCRSASGVRRARANSAPSR